MKKVKMPRDPNQRAKLILDRGARLTARPRSVATAAALIALTGIALLAVVLPLGIATLVLAVGVWHGSPWARWLGVLGGLAALLPGAYGLWGSVIVVQEWAACAEGRIASFAASYPAGYCGIVDWTRQIVVGLALLAPGVVGLFVVAVLMKHAPFFRGLTASN